MLRILCMFRNYNVYVVVSVPSPGYSDYLSLIVVNESELSTLSISLLNHNVSAVASLPVNSLESPDLFRSPGHMSLGRVLRIAHNKGSNQLLGGIALDLPAALEKVVVDIVNRHPLRLAPNLAEDLVGVVARNVVEAALLLGGGDTSGRLVQVDVSDNVGGGVSLLGGCLVLVDVEGDGGEGDGGAHHVSHALDDEAGVGGSRKGFVLH